MPLSRVTHQLISRNFISDIQRNLRSLNELQRQISTGKKIQYPSDNPVDADRILDYRQTVEQTKQYSKNVDDLNSAGSNVDGVLDTVTSLLFRARDLALRGSNEAPENQQNRDAIADELDQILHELVSQGNQKFDGKFLFAGNKTDSIPGNAPFQISNRLKFLADTTDAGNVTISMPSFGTGGGSTTQKVVTDNAKQTVKAIRVNGVIDAGATVDVFNNQITLSAALVASDEIEIEFSRDVVVDYHGDEEAREAEVSEGVKIGVNFPGSGVNSESSGIFGEYSAEPTAFKGVEAFQYLINLRDNLYKYDDVPGDQRKVEADIRASVSNIDTILGRINTVRADLGGRMNRLELAKNRLENININTQELLSSKEDTDMAEAISELVLQQNIYQAALGVGGKIMQISLLDFLR